MPAKIIHLWEGSVKIRIFRNWLFPDEHPLPSGFALTASALSFGMVLEKELKKRRPRTHFRVEVHPGNAEMLVDISDDHADKTGVFEDIARLSTQIAGQWRDQWMVKAGSEEEERMIAIVTERRAIIEQEARDPRITAKL